MALTREERPSEDAENTSPSLFHSVLSQQPWTVPMEEDAQLGEWCGNWMVAETEVVKTNPSQSQKQMLSETGLRNLFPEEAWGATFGSQRPVWGEAGSVAEERDKSDEMAAELSCSHRCLACPPAGLQSGHLVALALASSSPAVQPQGGLSGHHTCNLPQGSSEDLVSEAGIHHSWFTWGPWERWVETWLVISLPGCQPLCPHCVERVRLREGQPLAQDPQQVREGNQNGQELKHVLRPLHPNVRPASVLSLLGPGPGHGGLGGSCPTQKASPHLSCIPLTTTQGRFSVSFPSPPGKGAGRRGETSNEGYSTFSVCQALGTLRSIRSPSTGEICRKVTTAEEQTQGSDCFRDFAEGLWTQRWCLPQRRVRKLSGESDLKDEGCKKTQETVVILQVWSSGRRSGWSS
ncbi:uncharacterized protein [Symphalangus syndactylus]|uniref:uncharacterized protein n=1 Tax=Symphalangus syndactylus TaxID=9590 RepID=UPI00244303D1|nr:uncharacterized protein LOC129492650 [Symphalangus syndactylus]